MDWVWARGKTFSIIVTKNNIDHTISSQEVIKNEHSISNQKKIKGMGSVFFKKSNKVIILNVQPKSTKLTSKRVHNANGTGALEYGFTGIEYELILDCWATFKVIMNSWALTALEIKKVIQRCTLLLQEHWTR